MASNKTDEEWLDFAYNLHNYFTYDPANGEFKAKGIRGYSLTTHKFGMSCKVRDITIPCRYAAVIMNTDLVYKKFSVKHRNGNKFDCSWNNLEIIKNSVAMPFSDDELVNPENAGYIYEYRNKFNYMRYIGKTIDPVGRMESHVGSASKATTKFAKALAEEGIEAFEYKIIKVCHKIDMRYWEAFYIEKYASVKYGYNSVKVSYPKKRYEN